MISKGPFQPKLFCGFMILYIFCIPSWHIKQLSAVQDYHSAQNIIFMKPWMNTVFGKVLSDSKHLQHPRNVHWLFKTATSAFIFIRTRTAAVSGLIEGWMLLWGKCLSPFDSKRILSLIKEVRIIQHFAFIADSQIPLQRYASYKTSAFLQQIVLVLV